MRLCEYAKQVLLPQVPALECDKGGVSMLNIVYLYDQGQKINVFTYENRLKLLGEVVECYSILYVERAKNVQEYAELIGNATRANVRHACAICLEPHTNFILEGCEHCFHDVCLATWRQNMCPMCRKSICRMDQDRLKVAILGAAYDGRLAASHPLVAKLFMHE
jgi:hypothetical protein